MANRNNLNNRNLQMATFAMRCFWGPQQMFDNVKGVKHTTVGYTGGTKPNPTYGDMGDHTESVEIVFDPAEISYNELLEIFFKKHDPTQHATFQYRSAIFTHDDVQEMLAKTSVAAQAATKGRALTTAVQRADTFYPAEDYHQKYYEKLKREPKRCCVM